MTLKIKLSAAFLSYFAVKSGLIASTLASLLAKTPRNHCTGIFRLCFAPNQAPNAHVSTLHSLYHWLKLGLILFHKKQSLVFKKTTKSFSFHKNINLKNDVAKLSSYM